MLKPGSEAIRLGIFRLKHMRSDQGILQFGDDLVVNGKDLHNPLLAKGVQLPLIGIRMFLNSLNTMKVSCKRTLQFHQVSSSRLDGTPFSEADNVLKISNELVTDGISRLKIFTVPDNMLPMVIKLIWLL